MMVMVQGRINFAETTGKQIFRKFPNLMIVNIIDVPLFALFWVRIHVYLYLGPSEIYSIHVIHLDLSICI